jgi:hypothetical protein
MKHSIPHDLTPELARKATERAFDTYQQRFPDYKPTSKWVSPSRAEITFDAKVRTLNGAIELKPNEIELELEVPFVLRVFSGRAMKIVEEEIQEWITRAKNGELDD